LQRSELRDTRATVEVVLGPNSPVAETVTRLTPYLHANGLSWDGLKPFVELRRELFEIDTRFGQLGERGVFTALERAGVLEHQVAGVDRIEEAILNPPAVGRAKIRGECIRRFSQEKDRYVCTWDCIKDTASARTLDLSEPFATDEKWRQAQAIDEESLSLRLRRLMEEASAARRFRNAARRARLESALQEPSSPF
jgi:hypothetical protein